MVGLASSAKPSHICMSSWPIGASDLSGRLKVIRYGCHSACNIDPVSRGINETWAMDFVHDQLATGREIPVLTIVDAFSRFSPATDARFSYRGEDVVQTLEHVCKDVGYPRPAPRYESMA